MRIACVKFEFVFCMIVWVGIVLGFLEGIFYGLCDKIIKRIETLVDLESLL